MLVKLNNDWFGPDMKLYRVSYNPHEIDDSLKDVLPDSALIDNGKGEFVARGAILKTGDSDKSGEKNAIPDKPDTIVKK